MWWRKRAAPLPSPDTGNRLHEQRSIWLDKKYTLIQSRPNPGPPSLRLAALGNNKPRITQDIRVQTGKLDEPIISPLLTLTMSLHLPAWLTFLESWVCRLKRIPLTKTGAFPRFQTADRWKPICTFIYSCGTALMLAPPLCPCDPAR